MPELTEIAPLISAIASLIPWIIVLIAIFVFRKPLDEFMRTIRNAKKMPLSQHNRAAVFQITKP